MQKLISIQEIYFINFFWDALYLDMVKNQEEYFQIKTKSKEKEIDNRVGILKNEVEEVGEKLKENLRKRFAETKKEVET